MTPHAARPWRWLIAIAVLATLPACAATSNVTAPAPIRATTLITGTWNGSFDSWSGVVTIDAPGPVDASAVVRGFVEPMRLVLLANGGATTGDACTPLASPTLPQVGPVMTPPTITAHWDSVQVGSYCLNVISAVSGPFAAPPYVWTATVAHP